MVNLPFQSYKIEDRSFVAALKREIHLLASGVFSAVRAAELDIIVSELCSNLIKYAGGGEILYRLNTHEASPLFELLCIDNGPGMDNFSVSSRDGFSSGNTLGQGLGSIKRLANDFCCYTVSGWGTVAYVRFRSSLEYVEKKERLIYRDITVALAGERVSGDVTAMQLDNMRPSFFVADGLGHGEGANRAATAAAELYLEFADRDSAEIIRTMSPKLARTRGCVANIARANFQSRNWEICGVGNILLRVYDGLQQKNYITNNGVIGMALPGRLQNMLIPMSRFQQLIFCSDGIRSKWSLTAYPGILRYDPMLIAAAIYKDHSRGTDDSTILVIKEV